MIPPEERDRAAVSLAFLERFAEDEDRGQRRPLSAYLAMWPGYEDVVEREYAVLTETIAAADGRGADDAPRRLGAFRLERVVGRGAQGVVYRAHDESLDRAVALKVLRRGPADGVRARLRFEREARAAARLDHPCICTVYGTGVDGGHVYIVMRFVEGATLAERIGATDAPPSGEALRALVRAFAGVADGLHVAHEAGLLHRDIKPGNLMWTDSRLVLLDFGLARALDAGAPTLTATGEVFGTPAYMPPEQLRDGANSVTRTADVYALGITLYEAATLRRPFTGDSLEQLYTQVLGGSAPDPRPFNSALSRDLGTVIETAIDPDPLRRYATAADFAEDLRLVLARQPIRARPTPFWLRAYRWTERRPIVTTALLGLVVVAVTVGAIGLWLGETEQQRADRLRGSDARLRAEIDDLTLRGFQIGFGASPYPARRLFDRALELAPTDRAALAGRVLIEMPDTARALEVLDRWVPGLGAGAGSGAVADDDLRWLYGMILAAAGQGEEAKSFLDAIGPSRTALRAFLAGHLEVGNFMPPVGSERAQRAVALFDEAITRAERPRFHHYHSLMMAAMNAGDGATMDRAEQALTHHWPDAQATWEAIAQFRFTTEPERAEAAMRRVLALGPSATANLGLAKMAEHRGDLEAARDHYRSAIDADAQMPQAHWMLAELLQKQGDPEAALTSYRVAVLHAEDAFVAMYRSSFLRAVAGLRDVDRAITLLRAVVDERPDLAAGLRAELVAHFETPSAERIRAALR